MALITDMIGVHTVLGAFIAGILIGESPILSDHIEGQLRGVVTALFMPVFFGVAGLSANLTVLADPALALLTAGLVVIASVGKFSGAFAGGNIAGIFCAFELPWPDSRSLRGSSDASTMPKRRQGDRKQQCQSNVTMVFQKARTKRHLRVSYRRSGRSNSTGLAWHRPHSKPSAWPNFCSRV